MTTLYREDYKNEIAFMKNFFSLFVVDQRSLDTNILRLSDRFDGLSVERIEKLPYWRYEQFIDIANEMVKEEKTRQESESGQSNSNVPNTNSILNKMSSMANKFKS